MAIIDLFSKRQKRLPDVYRYDELPIPFRTQVVQILEEVFGQSSDAHRGFWRIHKALTKEYGWFQLPVQERRYRTQLGDPDYQTIIFEFFCVDPSVERGLDVIELSFREAYVHWQEIPPGMRSRLTPPDEAVAELNARFREHGIGYKFESGQVVKADSELLHQEAVRPALRVLLAPHFSGAEKEFLRAHEHYRNERFEEAIGDSLKALESTLKVICQRQGWSFDKNKATASTLIQIIFDNDLIPQYLQSQFSSLRSVLESGVPTIRNRDSGHGSGGAPRKVPEHLAAYALNLTASAIVFLAEAERVK